MSLEELEEFLHNSGSDLDWESDSEVYGDRCVTKIKKKTYIHLFFIHPHNLKSSTFKLEKNFWTFSLENSWIQAIGKFSGFLMISSRRL